VTTARNRAIDRIRRERVLAEKTQLLEAPDATEVDVFVALPAENHIELPIFETVLNGITVVGSIVGTRVDLREVFELHAAGKTRVIRETRSFGSVNEAMADVEAGRLPARIVFTPDPETTR
jgi:D-arabinose 1-dehydrogenase-like Zn-dependent alcohol dehydrogenase